jgi:hypothetical protein
LTDEPGVVRITRLEIDIVILTTRRKHPRETRNACQQRFPSGQTPGGKAIQLPYCNNFTSIWEYVHAFENGLIDFYLTIGDLPVRLYNSNFFMDASQSMEDAIVDRM